MIERLIVEPSHLPGKFNARLESTGKVVIEKTDQPLVDGARRLIEMGLDPALPLTMRHAGKGFDSFEPQTIGEWAKWTYSERQQGGLTRERWVPFSRPAEGQKQGSEGSGGV